jgi:hypothetical protein
VWGQSANSKFADGRNPADAFGRKPGYFIDRAMPPNVKPGTTGQHEAVWFKTFYQDKLDRPGKTLLASYHNENYPSTLP